MALSVWCEPVCATCSDASEGLHVYGGKIPVRELTEKAKQAGWLVTRDNFFCCRYCKDHFEEAHP